MKKIFFILTLICISNTALAHGNFGTTEIASGATLSAIWFAALLTAIIHTVMGPDHYLPFIAIAKSRDYSLKKTLFWTFICGLGHIASALLLALLFIYFSHWLSKENFLWLEENRGDIAAYALIGLGAAYILWALRHRFTHQHRLPDLQDKNISVWVLFIIFVLGPCEALLPILTASSVLGISAVISCTLIFSIATIATMMFCVTLGMLGINTLRFKSLENYAHEIAGGTIMACGLAIVCGL